MNLEVAQFNFRNHIGQPKLGPRQPMRTDRANADVPMCDKCDDIDKKVRRYRSYLTKITDQQFQVGVTKLIADLIAQKATLHPEQRNS